MIWISKKGLKGLFLTEHSLEFYIKIITDEIGDQCFRFKLYLFSFFLFFCSTFQSAIEPVAENNFAQRAVAKETGHSTIRLKVKVHPTSRLQVYMDQMLQDEVQIQVGAIRNFLNEHSCCFFPLPQYFNPEFRTFFFFAL